MQFKEAANVFGKGRAALSGKVGGMKDDVVRSSNAIDSSTMPDSHCLLRACSTFYSTFVTSTDVISVVQVIAMQLGIYFSKEEYLYR